MKLKRFWHSNGQDLVEFAILIPAMLFTIIVIIDLGRLIFHYNTLTNISRESARFAVVNPCTTNKDDVKSAIEDLPWTVGINLDNIVFDEPIYSHCTFPLPPEYATVKVNVTSEFQPIPIVINFVDNILSLGLDETISLSSSSTMHLERYEAE